MTLSTPAESHDEQIDDAPRRHEQHWGMVHYSPRWGMAMLGIAAVGLVGLHAAPLAVAALAGVGGLLLGYATTVEPRRPILERLDLYPSGLPHALDGLRIGQLSDMHLGMPWTAENLAWGVAAMLAEQPDLIVLTGDFVSRHRAIADLPGPLAQLRAPLGVYAIPGNHDHWESWGQIVRRLRPAGIVPLVNQGRLLRWNGGSFWLAGLDDLWAGRPDLGRALADAPTGVFVLLLSHAPESAPHASARGVGLQLSGHTHGGHVRLPGLGPLLLPYYGHRFEIGLARLDDTLIYTTRGLGGAPVRLGCPPEATILRLRASTPSSGVYHA